jgi:hypothetical protein
MTLMWAIPHFYIHLYGRDGGWNITAQQGAWPDNYHIGYDESALTVEFQYIQSEKLPSISDLLSNYHVNCDKQIPSVKNPVTNPLLGQQWCTECECGQCVVSNDFELFCLCNSYNGKAQECPAGSGYSGFANFDTIYNSDDDDDVCVSSTNDDEVCVSTQRSM